MAWIRRVRTASGATAVQIAESVAGRRRIVRHVGSARDEAELGLLLEEAHRLLADDQQGMLDLGITPASRRPRWSRRRRTAGLFPGAGGAPVAGAGAAAAGAQDFLGAALRRPGRGVLQPRLRRGRRRGLP